MAYDPILNNSIARTATGIPHPGQTYSVNLAHRHVYRCEATNAILSTGGAVILVCACGDVKFVPYPEKS